MELSNVTRPVSSISIVVRYSSGTVMLLVIFFCSVQRNSDSHCFTNFKLPLPVGASTHI